MANNSKTIPMGTQFKITQNSVFSHVIGRGPRSELTLNENSPFASSPTGTPLTDINTIFEVTANRNSDKATKNAFLGNYPGSYSGGYIVAKSIGADGEKPALIRISAKKFSDVAIIVENSETVPKATTSISAP